MNKLSLTLNSNYVSFVEKKIENNIINIIDFLNIASDNSGLTASDSYYYLNDSFVGDWYVLYGNSLYQKISDTDYTLLNYGDETIGLENILLNDYTVVANNYELIMFEFTTQSLFYKNENGQFINYGNQNDINDDTELTNLINLSPIRFVYFVNDVFSSLFNFQFPANSYYYFDNGFINVTNAQEIFNYNDALLLNNETIFRVGITPTFFYTHNLNQGEVWKTNESRTDIEIQIHHNCISFDDILNANNGEYLHINNNFFTQKEYQYGQILFYNDGVYTVYNPTNEEKFILLSDANIKFYNNKVTYSTESKLVKSNSVISFFDFNKNGYGNDCWIVYNPDTTKYYYKDSSNIYKYTGTYNLWTWDEIGTSFNIKKNYDIINEDNIFYIYDLTNFPNYKINYIYKFDCTELIDYTNNYNNDPDNVYNTLNNIFTGT